MQKTKNSLPERTRIQVIGLIQGVLSESIDLTLQAKNAHWNVKGANFIALHQLFDDVAEQSETYTDLIAERIAQLGGIAEGTLQVVAERSRLPEYPRRILSGKEHISALSYALASFGESTRRIIEQSNEVNDACTADIFTKISREVDKNLWLVETHLNNGET